jgi:hypothetical protein
MDSSNIDQAYGQLQTEFADVAKSIQTLAEKLNFATQGGDKNAREWLLDLKQVALDVKDEQIQINALLQQIHGFVDNANRQMQQQAVQLQAPQQQPQPFAQGGYGGGYGGGRRRGMFGGLLGGSFGQAIEMGAGIGLGEDLINSIF